MHRDNKDFKEEKYSDNGDLSSNSFLPYDSIFILKLISITLESENISLLTSKITSQFEVFLNSNRLKKRHSIIKWLKRKIRTIFKTTIVIKNEVKDMDLTDVKFLAETNIYKFLEENKNGENLIDRLMLMNLGVPSRNEVSVESKKFVLSNTSRHKWNRKYLKKKRFLVINRIYRKWSKSFDKISWRSPNHH